MQIHLLRGLQNRQANRKTQPFSLKLKKILSLFLIITLIFSASPITRIPLANAITIPDSDNDGMSDSWELAHGLNPNVNDAALDFDGDTLRNLEEYLIDTDPEAIVGSNPAISDSANDSDGDTFSNLAEKNSAQMTDPVNPDSFPNDGNLVKNPGILWLNSSNPTLPAGGWRKRNESATRIVSWGMDPQETRNGVLMSHQTDPSHSVTFGWDQIITGFEPGKWYEIGADIASDEQEPLIDVNGNIDIKTSWGILALFNVYNTSDPRFFNNSTLIQLIENGFQSSGPILSDWDQDHWVYRSFTPRGFEPWRKFRKFIKMPANAAGFQVLTYNFPKGKGYFDNFVVRKVEGYIDPLDRNPEEILIKKSGTLQFLQYKGNDFFPIMLHGWPRYKTGTQGWMDMQEVRDAGFNTVYQGDSYADPTGRSWQLAEIQSGLINADLAAMRGLQSPYQTSGSYMWTYDPDHNFPYGVPSSYGLPRIMSDIDAWKNFSNLLAFGPGWDEIESIPHVSGTWINNLRVEETTRDYIHGLGRIVFGNLASGRAGNTGMESDKVNYFFPLADLISNTANLPEAYFTPPSNPTKIPRLHEIGYNVRTFIHHAQQQGMTKYFMSFGLGNYCWAQWNGINNQCGENWEWDPGEPSSPLPFNLQRFLVFDQIINGAVAAGFFGSSNKVWMEDPFWQHSWDQMTRIATELESLMPVLLEPEFYGEWNVSDPRINIMMKKHNGKIYLLTSSAHYEDIPDVTIALDPQYTITSIKAINEVTNGNVANPETRDITNFTAHSFTDDFLGDDASSPAGVETPGYAVHIYEIEYWEDTDLDGLPDNWEMQHFGNLNQDANDDPDNDQSANLEEYQNGTDPNNPDTDGDGYSDGEEIAEGFNPNDPNNHPPSGDPEGCAIGSSDPLGLAAANSDSDPTHSVLFIDNNNCDCSDSGGRTAAMNPMTPWCSPVGFDEDRPNHKLNAGDTIYIRGGDYAITDQSSSSTNFYHIAIATSGTSNARITLRSYPNETVTIRGSSMSHKKIINFSNVNYWTIDGLNFVGYVNNGAGERLYIPYLIAFWNSQGIEIKNSTFGPIQGNDDIGYGYRNAPGQEGWGGPVNFDNVSSSTLDNVAISCTDDPSKITGRIGTLNADGFQCDNCQNITVTNSQFLDCGHVSLNFRNSSNILIERNTFNNRFHTSLGIGTITANPGITDDIVIRNNRFFGVNQFPSENTLRGGHIQLGPSGMTDVKIYNNLLYDGYNDASGIGLVLNFLQDPISGPIDNTQIFNNTIYKAGLRGIVYGIVGNPGPGQTGITNTKVYNNIIAESRTDPSIISNPQYEIAISLVDFVQNDGYGNEFKNNLVHTLNPDGIIAYSRYNGANNFSYTVDTFNDTNFADNTIGGNPLFTNASANDFHLQPTSPATNSGTCEPEVVTDFDGVTRNSDGVCAIGAFEYSAEYGGCTTGSSDPQGLANGTSVLFIDQNNCDCSDSYSRTQALDPNTPWCTPRALRETAPYQKLNIGDTVYIRGGDYFLADIDANNTIYIRSSGTSTNRITIRGYPSETVNLHGSNITQQGSSIGIAMLVFYLANYITLDSLNFIGHIDTQNGRLYAPYVMKISRSNNIEIKNVTISDFTGNDDIGLGTRWPPEQSYAETWANGIVIYDADGTKFENLNLNCTASPSLLLVNGGGVDGIIADNARNTIVQNSWFGDCGHISLSLRNCENALIENSTFNNRFHTAFAFGQINANPGVSRNTIVRNNTFFGTNEFPSESNARGGAIQIGNSERSYIYNNVIHTGLNDSTGITLLANVQIPEITRDMYIFNNTIHSPGPRAIYIGNWNFNPPDQINGISDIRIWNNILMNANHDYVSPASFGNIFNAELLILHYDTLENVDTNFNGYGNDVRNNLIYSSDPADQNSVVRALKDGGGNGQIFVSNNYSAAMFNGLNLADSNIQTNPLFVDSVNADFNLQNGSPAINSGMCLDIVETGFFNVSVSPITSIGCHIGAIAPSAISQPLMALPPSPNNGNLNLTWSAVPNMTIYQAQISPDPSFLTSIDERWPSGTFEPVINYSQGTFYARVRGWEVAPNPPFQIGVGPTEFSNTVQFVVDLTPPSGTFTIDNNNATAYSINVNLNMSATDTGGATVGSALLSNDGVSWSDPQSYQNVIGWRLNQGPSGDRTVYAKFIDSVGNISNVTSDTIYFEAGWSCDATGPIGPGGEPSCTPICGDGLVVGSEQCDDNNTVSGDGCDSNCQNEVVPECLTNFDCDDNNTCNGTESCNSGVCQPGALLVCDDGNMCNGTETCDAGLGCLAGSPLTCVDDGNSCTSESCNPAVGCQSTPVADGMSCADALFCNGEEVCLSGVCENAQNPCLDPAHCDEPNDQCFACVSDSECDDGNLCNGSEACVNNTCQAGAPLVCDDANVCNGTETCDPGLGCQQGTSLSCDDGIACTTDSCDPVNGCASALDDSVCSDGLFCNGNETCNATAGCQNNPAPCSGPNLVCDEAGDQCTGCLADSDCNDNNACNGIESCNASVCQSGTPLSCDDSNVCNGTETCDPSLGCQTGSPLNCNDGISCTNDLCNPVNGCLYTPDDSICSDNLFCNGSETCNATAGCQNNPAPCSGPNLVCDESGDQCAECLSDADCDDNNTCNGTETCSANTCQSGTPLTCDDANICNGTESCDPIQGCQIATALHCDDNDACNGTESCNPATGCESGMALNCDDADICTADSCDALTGCGHTIIADCRPCSDDSDCVDTNLCNGTEFCSTGFCQAGTALVCDDGNACNGTESCNPVNGCEAGLPLICDDSSTCTSDACNPILGCQNTSVNCDDNNACTADACDPVTGCLNTIINCDDGNICTVDSCDITTGCRNELIQGCGLEEESASDPEPTDSPEPPSNSDPNGGYYGPSIVGIPMPAQNTAPEPAPQVEGKSTPQPSKQSQPGVSVASSDSSTDIATITGGLDEIDVPAPAISSFIQKSTRVAPLRIGVASLQQLNNFNIEMIRLRGGPKNSGNPIKTFLEILFEIIIEKAPTTISLSV